MAQGAHLFKRNLDAPMPPNPPERVLLSLFSLLRDRVLPLRVPRLRGVAGPLLLWLVRQQRLVPNLQLWALLLRRTRSRAVPAVAAHRVCVVNARRIFL